MSELLQTNAAMNLSALPDIPDFLGTAARVDSVASLLQQAQEQLQNLRHIMVLNQETPEDHIAVGNGQSDAPTYQQRFDALTSGMRELMDQNQDIREELEVEAVKRRRQVERKIEQAASD